MKENLVQQIVEAQAEAAAAKLATIKIQVGREFDLTLQESEALEGDDVDQLIAEARKVAESKADHLRHSFARAVGLQHSAEPEVTRDRVVVVRSGSSSPGMLKRPAHSLKDEMEQHLRGDR